MACVVIESEGKETGGVVASPDLQGREAIETLLEAGIPLDYQRLAAQGVESVLVNGTEFEPQIAAHHGLLLEKADEVLRGLRSVMTIFSVPKASLCIEKQQSTLIDLLTRKAEFTPGVTVQPVAEACPLGTETVSLKKALKIKGGVESNAVCSIDLSHLLAGDEAITKGIPFVERLITVTGSGIAFPQNIRVRIGSPFGEVITHCGGDLDRITQVIQGGMLMGLSQHSTQVPVTKETAGILALISLPVTGSHRSRIYERGPCIRCAKCVDRCPVSILPYRIAAFCEKRRFLDAVQTGLFACIDCGLCSYVCPARIPLAQILKSAKSREDFRTTERTQRGVL